MHLDEERIQRLIAGELPPADDQATREHLERCAECRALVGRAASEARAIEGLLERLDLGSPSFDAGAVAARARADQARGSRTGVRFLARAAGFVVALLIAAAGYAAYAAPGSPMRAWVTTLTTWLGVRALGPAAPPAPSPPKRGLAGIAVSPGSQLVIVFAYPGGVARVSLTDGDDVAVHAPSGSATFTSDGQRLVIDNRGDSVTFEIEIPRSAPRVEVRVGGHQLLLKEGARVSARSSAQADSSYRLPLLQSGR